MSNQAANEPVGRSKHLGQLALVFKHRHGTWADFGQFLKHIFSDSPTAGEVIGVPKMVKPKCRHNSGGKHYEILKDCEKNPQKYPMFAHERYTCRCVSIGAFEDKKNPGLVVADMCNKAKDFLSSIGKGDPNEATGRDFEFEPATSSPLTSPGHSQVPDSQGSIDLGNIVDGPRVPGGESFDGDDLFADEDVLVELQPLLGEVNEVGSRPQTASSIETLSGFGDSQDSVLQLTGRSSTKIRAATLGYLWGFADRPTELREEFRKLRRNPDLQVLHLCGCGICYTNAVTGERVPGCCERSHLKLGLAVENGRHTNHHLMMSLAVDDDYPQLCGIVHRAVDGDGLF